MCKLDNGRVMSMEVQQTQLVASLVGAGAITIMRGPQYVDAGGQEKQESLQMLVKEVDGAIDGPLIERLLDSSIRLVSCEWLSLSPALLPPFSRLWLPPFSRFLAFLLPLPTHLLPPPSSAHRCAACGSPPRPPTATSPATS